MALDNNPREQGFKSDREVQVIIGTFLLFRKETSKRGIYKIQDGEG